MSNGLILAIDQGTTNTKALAFDGDGRVVASAVVPMAVAYPRPGWAEQDPQDIWQSVRKVIADVVRATSPDMDAIAISNQRETVIVWDAASGKPIAPAILWQCRRSTERCVSIRAAGHGPLIEDRTGLGIDPLFPAAKIAWILDSVPSARDAAASGRLRAGTVDAWLLWNLSGGRVHATDFSNASRTQLLDTQALRWDEELAAIFDVPVSILPDVRNSDSHFADVATGTTALAGRTPVRAMLGDSHAALFGHGVRSPGTVKATYGTGSSLMTLTDGRVRSRHGLSSTIAWSTSEGVTYALEGNISVSGQAPAFMSDMLGLRGAAELAALARTVPDSNGVSFVPALVGLGAPHWAPLARGMIDGLALGTKPAHLARAAIESIALQIADVFETMEMDLGSPLAELSADGGASQNDDLMQYQADILAVPVNRGDLAEVSAVGAMLMAASAMGKAVTPAEGTPRLFMPASSEASRTAALRQWREAVQRTLWSSSNN